MFLRQRIAVSLIGPEARKRIEASVEDGSEQYEEELAKALKQAGV
jgi:hypothetical protein